MYICVCTEGAGVAFLFVFKVRQIISAPFQYFHIFSLLFPKISRKSCIFTRVAASEYLVYCTQFPKLCIRNSSPYLHNSAILRTTKSIAELRTKKSCGTAIADLQNLTSAILQLSAVSCQFRCFLVPFSQLRMVLKISQ